MTYTENVFICLAAPILVAVLCLHGEKRGRMLFLLGGVSTCFLSSYITTYLAELFDANNRTAAIGIAPTVEECMKFAPILLYMLMMEPKKKNIPERFLMVSVGFATFENVCYLITSGSRDLLHLLVRGFGAGAMHVICGALISAGIVVLWEKSWLREVGMIVTLAVAILYHTIYNLLVTQSGVPMVIGFLIPSVTTIAVIIVRGVFFKNKNVFE